MVLRGPRLSGNPNIGATLFGLFITPIAEPMSLGLLGSGLLAAGWFGRRWSKKAI